MSKWQMKSLGDLCVIERGGSPRPIDEYITDDPNGVNWIKIGDTTESMYITATKEKIIPEGIKKSRYVKKGDFILSNSMSFGRPYILDIDGCIHDGWLVIRDNDELFDKRFLYYFLGSPVIYEKFKSMAVGGVVNNLNIDMVKKVSVPILSLSEQRKIADELDKVSMLIEHRKQQLSKLDELVKARFVEMFGDIYETSEWDKKPWSELVTIQNGRDYKNILVESGGYPVYGTGGEMARASNYLCPENTIIVGRKGTINNPLLVKEKFWNVDTAFGVIVGKQMHYQYFYNFCRMFDFSTLNKQAVLPSTTKADLLKIEIAVPPIELQNQFAAFVEQIDKSKLVIQQSLEKLETLKKSLMQQYFG